MRVPGCVISTGGDTSAISCVASMRPPAATYCEAPGDGGLQELRLEGHSASAGRGFRRSARLQCWGRGRARGRLSIGTRASPAAVSRAATLSLIGGSNGTIQTEQAHLSGYRDRSQDSTAASSSVPADHTPGEDLSQAGKELLTLKASIAARRYTSFDGKRRSGEVIRMLALRSVLQHMILRF